jgi:hypothetical protein
MCLQVVEPAKQRELRTRQTLDVRLVLCRCMDEIYRTGGEKHHLRTTDDCVRMCATSLDAACLKVVQARMSLRL